MTIVAVSREMGSGGYEIASAVAKALDFEYVDREILLQAARVHEVPEEKIVDVAERHLSLWERFDEEKRRYLVFIEAAYYAFAEKGRAAGAALTAALSGTAPKRARHSVLPTTLVLRESTAPPTSR